MKWLSDAEYEALIKKGEKKEDSEKVKELREEIRNITRLHDLFAENTRRDAKNVAEDHKIALARKDAEVDTKVMVATKELTEQLTTAKIAENNATQKATILEEAFKNLGYDVKSMSGLMEKLVEGLSSKNTVQLISTGGKGE